MSEQATGTPPNPGFAVDLGCSGVIRLRAATHVVPKLLALDPAKVIDGFEGTVGLKGVADNLDRRIRAKLTWLVDKGGNRVELPHEQDVVLVPESQSGPLKDVKFAVKMLAPKKKAQATAAADGATAMDVADDAEIVDLAYNVFQLGLYGVGPLGFRLEPYDPAVAPCTLETSSSNGSLKIPIEVFLLDGRTNVELDRAAVRVGSKIGVRVTADQNLFAKHVAMLDLWESEERTGEEEESPEPVDCQTWSWSLAEPHVEYLRLGVERRFWYTRQLAGKDDLCFRYRIRVAKEKADGTVEPIEGAKPVVEELLVQAPSPQLVAWQIDPATTAKVDGPKGPTLVPVSGSVANLAPDFRLPLEATVYSHLVAADAGHDIHVLTSAPVVMQTESAPTDSGQAGTAGHFAADIPLSPDGDQYLVHHAEARLFAVLALAHQDGAPPTFAKLIGYDANMKDDGKDTGFAPFDQGALSSPTCGTGVCTNLRTQTREGQEEILESDVAWVPQDRLEAFYTVLATVYGESNRSSHGAWRAVVHVIMNRVGKREWGKHGQNSPEEVVKHGFDAYTNRGREKSLYSRAWSYLHGDRKQPDKSIEDMVKVVAPVFMGREAKDDPTHGATFYFSPRCQKKLGRERPGFSTNGKCDFVHVAILSATDDFEFYRYKGDQ